MTRTSKTTLRLSAIAAGFALAVNLLTAPAAIADDRGKRWDRDRNHRVERHYDRGRDVRRAHKRDHKAYKRYHKAHKRGRRVIIRHHPPKHHHHHHYVVKKDRSVAPVVVGIGLGILTYAILNESHGHGY